MSPANAALMEKGHVLMRSGDIASARLLFQRLANAGIADAALALAATYDPRSPHAPRPPLFSVARLKHWSLTKSATAASLAFRFAEAAPA